MQSETISLNRQNEWEAIRRVIARTRTNAYLGVSHKELGKALDDVQDLLTLALEPGDRDESERQAEFRMLLGEIENRYTGMSGITGRSMK